METLLTVVIPAYNAEKYIKYTLDSLCDECTNKRLVLEKPEISDMEKGETEPDARYQKNGQSCLEVLVVGGARPVSKGRRCRRLGRAAGIFKFIRCIGTYQR